MLIIGICGGSGAGKSSLCKRLREALSAKVDVQVISHDSYYKDISHLTLQERSQTNFDHPDSLDTPLLVQHITGLKNGKTMHIPTYDFSTHSRTSRTIKVIPTQVVIIEGILILASPALRSLFDISFFVESRADTRLARRITRDMKERGRTAESVIQQFQGTVQPMYEQWVAPTKKNS